MPVFVGGLLGATLVFVFSALAIKAVGKAAQVVIAEVRRQFREHPGIMAGTEKPDYARCVDIVTRAALREMVAPGLLAVLTPVAVGYSFKYLGGEGQMGAESVAALLMVGTIAGILMAMFMNNGGGAWDNAKKYIESGLFMVDGQVVGKRSEPHKAAWVGVPWAIHSRTPRAVAARPYQAAVHDHAGVARCISWRPVHQGGTRFETAPRRPARGRDIVGFRHRRREHRRPRDQWGGTAPKVVETSGSRRSVCALVGTRQTLIVLFSEPACGIHEYTASPRIAP